MKNFDNTDSYDCMYHHHKDIGSRCMNSIIALQCTGQLFCMQISNNTTYHTSRDRGDPCDLVVNRYNNYKHPMSMYIYVISHI